MNVLLGRPAAAFTNLTFLLDQYILPNTFYHEGENGECGETPPAASNHPLYPPRMLRPLPDPALLECGEGLDWLLFLPPPSCVDVGAGAIACGCRCWCRCPLVPVLVPGAGCQVPGALL